MKLKIKKKKNRKKKMTRVVHWILTHPEEFFLICGVGAERMTDEKFEKMWCFLREQKFEVLFIVLITVHHERMGINVE